MRYIQVVLPLKLSWEPFYSTEDREVDVGSRVSVMFAGRRYIGAVCSVDVKPVIDVNKVLPILEKESSLEPVKPEEFELWRFVSDYYLCSMGEVFKIAYPKTKIKREYLKERSRERMLKLLEATKTQLAHARKESVRQKCLEKIEKYEKILYPPQQKPASQKRQAGKPLLLHCEDYSQRIYRLCQEISEVIQNGGSVMVITPSNAECRSIKEKVSQYLNLSSDKQRSRLVFGAKNMLLRKTPDLALIIIEQEQDPAYKHDFAPCYNARDLAVYVGALYKAEVILSTDSPSLESLYNCRCGKYSLEYTKSEVSHETELISIPAENAKNGMSGSFSRKMIEALNEQSAPVRLIRCYEKEEELRTQIAGLFPERKDISIVSAYSCRRESTYAGTTAVLQADIFFNKDDFRADERALQDLTHLKQTCGKMIIQTCNPKHPVYRIITGKEEVDYDSMLKEREDFALPPYTRLIDLVIEDNNPKRLAYMASELQNATGALSPMGPVPLPPKALKLRFSLKRDTNMRPRKSALKEIVCRFERERKYEGHIKIDVDPL